MTHKSDKKLLDHLDRLESDGIKFSVFLFDEEIDRLRSLARTGLDAQEQKRICNGEPDENGVILDGTDGACPAWGRGVERGWEKGQERIGELEGAIKKAHEKMGNGFVQTLMCDDSWDAVVNELKALLPKGGVGK